MSHTGQCTIHVTIRCTPNTNIVHESQTECIYWISREQRHGEFVELNSLFGAWVFQVIYQGEIEDDGGTLAPGARF